MSLSRLSDHRLAPPLPPVCRAAALEGLRARVGHIKRRHTPRDAVTLCPGIDGWLPDHGLARGGMHEVLAADQGAATGFCAVVLGRLGGTVAWIGPEPDAAPQGLAWFGLEPSRLLFIEVGKASDALWAMEEALRCPALAGAVLASPPLGSTTTRRLQLATEIGGSLGLVLLPNEVAVAPTTALTRWRVGSDGTTPERNELRNRTSRWQLDLLRARGGRPGCWSVSWEPSTHSLVG